MEEGSVGEKEWRERRVRNRRRGGKDGRRLEEGWGRWWRRGGESEGREGRTVEEGRRLEEVGRKGRGVEESVGGEMRVEEIGIMNKKEEREESTIDAVSHELYITFHQ